MEDKKAKIMNDTTDILHHVGLISPDLDALATCYERLGFSLTPLSLPKIIIRPGGEPESFGAGNRHAIFKNNYLELLGIVDPKKWGVITREQRGPYDLDVPLSRYTGLHVMHFGTDHIELVRERLIKQGIPCSGVMNFQRNVQTPDGERTMRAKTIHFPPGSNPEGLLQIAQHDTPELIFQPRYMLHSNGATALTEIIVCAEDPAAYASKYEKYTGHKSTGTGNNHFVIELGSSTIKIMDPAHLDSIIPGYVAPALPFLAAFTVETSSLLLVYNTLLSNGIPFSETDTSIIVYPAYAGGCAVIFKEQQHI